MFHYIVPHRAEVVNLFTIGKICDMLYKNTQHDLPQPLTALCGRIAKKDEMYLVVGLGNPEKKYFNTPHNMGFAAADRLAEKLNAEFTKVECKSVTAHVKVNGVKVIIAKPVTYMNLSGDAVAELVRKYKVEKGNLAVVYDDTDIPMGQLRVRAQGSAGSHNGMKSIVQLLGTEDFVRVRVGIGKETPLARIDYVLSQITEEDKQLLDPALDRAAQALSDFVHGCPVDKVMQQYNGK